MGQETPENDQGRSVSHWLTLQDLQNQVNSMQAQIRELHGQVERLRQQILASVYPTNRSKG